MPSQDHKKPLIVILGPTAVGKTEISLQLAERLNGEIVSADSRLFYRGMDIGTAKPSLAERSRIRHHLIDIVNPDENWNLATYQQAAYEAIDDIHTRERLPFLVGGTGQFIRAVTEGWDIPEVEPRIDLRAVLENWAEQIGSQGLYDRLVVLDPASATRIEPQNLRRIIRALEVILQTGKRFSSQRGLHGSKYEILLLGLNRPRPELYDRVDARIQAMLDTGLVSEVKFLLDAGYSPDLPPLSAIGYRQIIAYLQGKISLEEAVVQMKRKTRRFVRSQANWFKLNDPEILWVQAGLDVADEMEKAIIQFLKNKSIPKKPENHKN